MSCCQCPAPPGYDPEVDDPLPKYRNKCGCPTATLECVSSEKVAMLVGYPEFINPSSPPRKYLRADVSGTHSLLNELGNGSTGTWSGYYQYIPDGIDVNNFLFSWEDINVTIGNTSGECTNTCGGSNFFKLLMSFSACRYPVSGSCDTELNNLENPQYTKTSFSIDPRQAPASTGTWTATLSEEDTEENALARATETAGTVCTSRYDLRTTSFTFTVRTASYSVTATNLCVGRSYQGCVRLRRRKSFSGTVPDGESTDWEDVEPDTIASFVATAKEMEIETDVPLPGGDDESIGWEYQAVSAHVWWVGAGCDCPTNYVAPAP